jgi:flagellar basal body-associated protein FliL
MAEEMKPSPPTTPPDEVSLEDIDKILHADDPGFAEGLKEVQAGGEATEVEIELIHIDEKALEEGVEEEPPGRWDKLFQKIPGLKRIVPAFHRKGVRLRNALVIRSGAWAHWLKVGPKDYAKYLFSQVKGLGGLLKSGLKKFGALPGSQKWAFLFFLCILAGGVTLISFNLKGRWVPAIDRPLLKDFSEVADHIWSLKGGKEAAEGPAWVSLLQALRQPEHRYLFDKVVVNLKRVGGAEETNPMGLFEFYVEVDSKETAVEVGERKVELLDLVQRTVEGETYNSLSGEPGKQRLKNLIRQELNQVLHDGWVKDVYISNMVLKP